MCRRGLLKPTLVLAAQTTTGYVHTIKLQVTGLPQWLDIEVGFIESDNVSPLLGQNGFFSQYQVIFEGYRKQFEVNTRERAVMTGRRRGH